MAKLDLLIQAWDEGHREFAIALEGLSDEDLWTRPHPKLLSIGELAGHMMYWEALMVGKDRLPGDVIEGILVDPAFNYYTEEIGQPVKLDIGVAELLTEVKRVHELAKKAMLDFDPASADALPGEGWTWGYYLQYRVFHTAYHTGQAYSVRHLLGHTPTDN